MKQLLFSLLLTTFTVRAAAQCTYTLPASTIVLTHDTVLNHCLAPVNLVYLLCGDITVQDSSTCTNFITYYVDSLATLEIDSGFAALAYTTVYVKPGGSFDANYSFRTDTIYSTSGSYVEDTLAMTVSLDPGCIIFDYSLLGGNPCLSTEAQPGKEPFPLTVWPVPARDELYLHAPAAGRYEWQLLNLQGTVVRSGIAAAQSEQITLKGLPSGIYLLRAQHDRGTAVHKVVVE